MKTTKFEVFEAIGAILVFQKGVRHISVCVWIVIILLLTQIS